MLNYYDILEIHEEVSTAEIRRSFRTLIKKYHPDIHGPNKVWADAKTKVIIQAYKTLSDSIARKQYDRIFKHTLKARRTQKTYAREETITENMQAKVRVILTDLLNCHIHKAIEKYERLLKEHAGDGFLLHLSHRDYIDCKFLLAEAYEKLKNYEVAIKLYEFVLERGKNTFHRSHLLDEIKERIRNIYCRTLAKRATPEKALGYYEKVLKLNLYKNKNAFIYKKMAECHLKLKNYENALKYLSIALSLKPNLQGLSKLTIKLREYMPNFAI